MKKEQHQLVGLWAKILAIDEDIYYKNRNKIGDQDSILLLSWRLKMKKCWLNRIEGAESF